MVEDISDDRNLSEARRQWDSGIEFGAGSNTYALLRALLSQADSVDDDIEAIYEAQHVDTATGGALDSFGDLVNVDRQTGENDDRYRARIKANFRASTIGTTYDEFVEFVASVLRTNSANFDVTTEYPSNPATVRVGAESTIYEDVGFDASTVANLLSNGVPAGHEVEVIEQGTFRLTGDDPDNLDGSNGLTGDGTSEGGTLSGDLN